MYKLVVAGKWVFTGEVVSLISEWHREGIGLPCVFSPKSMSIQELKRGAVIAARLGGTGQGSGLPEYCPC